MTQKELKVHVRPVNLVPIPTQTRNHANHHHSIMLIPVVHFHVAPIITTNEAKRSPQLNCIWVLCISAPIGAQLCTVPLRTCRTTGPFSRAHVHIHALTFHLAAVLDASLVGFDWQLQQRLQVGHGSQVTALSPNSSRIAGSEVGAGGPCREIRRQELGERPGHNF